MLATLFDPLIGALRPFHLRGKGFAFNFVTPRSGMRTVPVWRDYRMTIDLGNAIQRQVYMGCFGCQITGWARALLPPGGTFLDVGANIGYFTLLAAHCVGPGGRVFAVEPNPTVFGLLEEHLRVNKVGAVQAHRLALADRDGSWRLYVPPAGENRDYNVTCFERPGWTPIDVPCRRLDECLSEWHVETIDVMKMDVEGGEPHVLAGGAEALRRGAVRYLITEVNGPRLQESGSSPARLVEQLGELGFSPARLRRQRAVAVPASSWDLHPDHEYDRLFRHRSAA